MQCLDFVGFALDIQFCRFGSGLWLMKIFSGVHELHAICYLGTARNENLVLLGKPKYVLNVFRMRTVYFSVI